MYNRFNYPDTILPPIVNIRPDRLSNADRNIVEDGTKQVVFGITADDVVELWLYNNNGVIVGHTTLQATNPKLSLSTAIDNTGAYELLNLDMGALVRTMVIDTGRYGATVNFFRNEVGSETENHLYIADISDDRTELRLHPKTVTDTVVRDLYEWVVPSVPKEIAKGLVDQTFGKSVDDQDANILTNAKISADVEYLQTPTGARIEYASATTVYNQMLTNIQSVLYTRTLSKMAEDKNNRNIQEADLESYLSVALHEIIAEMKNSDQIDPRFEVV